MLGPWTVSSRWLAAVVLVVGATLGCANAESSQAIQVAAEKEGSIVWYSAMRSEHIELIAKQFRRDFPKIKLTRSFSHPARWPRG